MRNSTTGKPSQAAPDTQASTEAFTRVPSRLEGRDLSLGYPDLLVAEHLSVRIPDQAFTVIVGPNACGKSTLLRALARLAPPRQGAVLLDGSAISQYPTCEVARRLGLLPQTASAPEGIRVRELVARGRYPHRSLLRGWRQEDEDAVEQALAQTSIGELAYRLVDELSGGQRQRVWVAMVLAQQTPLLLLDEPTTYLDIAHQIDLLELFRALNRQAGRTVLAVLHDINHACRYADHLIAMREGRIVVEGPPSDIVTPSFMEQVFGLACVVVDDPVTHTPMVVPLGVPRSSTANASGCVITPAAG